MPSGSIKNSTPWRAFELGTTNDAQEYSRPKGGSPSENGHVFRAVAIEPNNVVHRPQAIGGQC
jgi:hypothetical protein